MAYLQTWPTTIGDSGEDITSLFSEEDNQLLGATSWAEGVIAGERRNGLGLGSECECIPIADLSVLILETTMLRTAAALMPHRCDEYVPKVNWTDELWMRMDEEYDPTKDCIHTSPSNQG